MKESRASPLSQGASWPTSGLLARLVAAPQARPTRTTSERLGWSLGLQPFIKKAVCWGGGLLKVHPSSASQALPEEEVSRFPFKGDPEMWALRVSWGPKTGVEGTARTCSSPGQAP